MLHFKKLYLYIVWNFISLFFATFFICLFVVVMQFLWMHIDDLVGKGLGMSVLAEFFLYSSVTLIPMALPLAILLASLMSFGSFGEKLELLAMKTSGISLFRIMKPLIFLVIGLSIAGFYIANDVVPVAQGKLWSLIFSLRHKSPEVEIPAGEFYSEINDLNIYVREKDSKKRLLKNIMIYDFSSGFRNATVMTADSARIMSTDDKLNLKLVLHDGETFENLKQDNSSTRDNVPYRRETFRLKEIILDFNSNLNRMDETLLHSQHVCKNSTKLLHDIDSAKQVGDSLTRNFQKKIQNDTYMRSTRELAMRDTMASAPAREKKYLDHDSLYWSLNKDKMSRASKKAINDVEVALNHFKYDLVTIRENSRYITRHEIEWHKKFSLSIACLIFFFIGSPLGAIIGKGGLGMPTVICILLFVIYYIIDTAGNKMAKEAVWPIWCGMWLSTAVLFPLGVFLTYKAAKDSTLFYEGTFKRVKEVFNQILTTIKTFRIWNTTKK